MTQNPLDHDLSATPTDPRAEIQDDPAISGMPVPEPAPPKKMPKEIGGPKGPEPTRYGDWEQKGRCTDF